MLVADGGQQTCEPYRYLWTCMCVCVCSDQGGILDHLYTRNNVLTARIMDLLCLSVMNSGFTHATTSRVKTNHYEKNPITSWAEKMWITKCIFFPVCVHACVGECEREKEASASGAGKPWLDWHVIN